jgi:trk system potassium uptake protein TrkA
MRLMHQGVLEMLPLGDDLVITELAAPPSFVGRTLHELALPKRFLVTVVAVRRNRGGRGTLVLPTPLAPLEAGDILVVVSPPAAANDLLARL